MTPLFETTFGSHLYGCPTPTSDVDYKGLFLSSADELLLGHAPATYSNNEAGIDREYFSVYRYLELLAQGQTVALDMFFSPRQLWKHASPLWHDILAAKPKLLNKKCGAAVGYARAQAERYSLRGDRIASLEAVLSVLSAHKPSTILQDALLSSGYDLRKLPHVKILDKPLGEGNSVKLLEVCGKQVGLLSAVKYAVDIFQHQLDQYGERAKEARDASGADWKALYHAVRVGDQALELLRTGEIRFPRPNASELLAIRLGLLGISEVYARIERNLAEIPEAQSKSSLPEASDQKWIREFVISTHRDVVLDTGSD